MTTEQKESGRLQPANAMELAGLVDYSPDAVVSRTIHKSKGTTMTVFSFDAGQELSEHSAPFDAYVMVLDGRVILTIGGADVEAKPGEIVLMPADVPHGLRAPERFKMLLTMARE